MSADNPRSPSHDALQQSQAQKAVAEAIRAKADRQAAPESDEKTTGTPDQTASPAAPRGQDASQQAPEEVWRKMKGEDSTGSETRGRDAAGRGVDVGPQARLDVGNAQEGRAVDRGQIADIIAEIRARFDRFEERFAERLSRVEGQLAHTNTSEDGQLSQGATPDTEANSRAMAERNQSGRDGTDAPGNLRGTVQGGQLGDRRGGEHAQAASSDTSPANVARPQDPWGLSNPSDASALRPAVLQALRTAGERHERRADVAVAADRAAFRIPATAGERSGQFRGAISVAEKGTNGDSIDAADGGHTRDRVAFRIPATAGERADQFRAAISRAEKSGDSIDAADRGHIREAVRGKLSAENFTGAGAIGNLIQEVMPLFHHVTASAGWGAAFATLTIVGFFLQKVEGHRNRIEHDRTNK